MCLLLFAWQTELSFPLVVAANRDERLDRPSQPFDVLQESGPRILGGRDQLAGGTWLAVNDSGVVAGLTNRPSPGGPDRTKRSRGELPLLLAGHGRAEDGVAELVERVYPGQYNPAWLLVGDRTSLFYVELADDRAPVVRSLPPGIHILENVALGHPSSKVDQVRSLLTTAETGGEGLWPTLRAVLADHTVPTNHTAAVTGPEGAAVERRPATLAACVHTDDYGTRSAELVRVPIEPGARPEVLVAEGPPCSASFVDVSTRWAGSPT
jgi:uncharacterized protein with NRDE domain